MLKYSISNSLFDQFRSDYHTLPEIKQTTPEDPFVFVDSEGNLKLLTDVVDVDKTQSGIFAVSMSGDGYMELLSFAES